MKPIRFKITFKCWLFYPRLFIFSQKEKDAMSNMHRKLTLYCTIIPRASFFRKSLTKVEEASVVSSCFNFPSNAKPGWERVFCKDGLKVNFWCQSAVCAFMGNPSSSSCSVMIILAVRCLNKVISTVWTTCESETVFRYIEYYSSVAKIIQKKLQWLLVHISCER